MFNAFVYVVESPGAVDILDGRTEGRSLCEMFELANIPYSYSLAVTKQAFCNSLSERFNTILEERQMWPIIHLSMHGNPDGVALTDGTFITWNDLYQLLAVPFDLTGGYLLICMSSCCGGFANVMAMQNTERPPYGALVGSTHPTDWHDAAVGYIAFYHQLFKRADLQFSVDVMKIASGDSNFVIRWGKEDHQRFKEYLQHLQFREMMDSLMQRLRSRRRPNESSGI